LEPGQPPAAPDDDRPDDRVRDHLRPALQLPVRLAPAGHAGMACDAQPDRRGGVVRARPPPARGGACRLAALHLAAPAPGGAPPGTTPFRDAGAAPTQ